MTEPQACQQRRQAARKLRHRATQLRKTADELDAIATEIEGEPEQQKDGSDGYARNSKNR